MGCGVWGVGRGVWARTARGRLSVVAIGSQHSRVKVLRLLPCDRVSRVVLDLPSHDSQRHCSLQVSARTHGEPRAGQWLAVEAATQ